MILFSKQFQQWVFFFSTAPGGKSCSVHHRKEVGLSFGQCLWFTFLPGNFMWLQDFPLSWTTAGNLFKLFNSTQMLKLNSPSWGFFLLSLSCSGLPSSTAHLSNLFFFLQGLHLYKQTKICLFSYNKNGNGYEMFWNVTFLTRMSFLAFSGCFYESERAVLLMSFNSYVSLKSDPAFGSANGKSTWESKRTKWSCKAKILQV